MGTLNMGVDITFIMKSLTTYVMLHKISFKVEKLVNSWKLVNKNWKIILFNYKYSIKLIIEIVKKYKKIKK